MLFTFVNLQKWQELPKSYQAVLEHAGHYANNWMMAKYDALNPAALKRLIAAGAKLQPFSQPIMDACLKAANETHAEIAATNADFKKVLDSMTAFRNDEYLWWQIAEYSYDTYMIRTRPRT